jgi:nicotinate-nucleotide pyrophosphorylase (carboxylating)
MSTDLVHDSRVTRLIEIALMEDASMGDLTSEAIIPEDQLSRATFLCKADGVVAGLDIAGLVFRLVDSSITLHPAVRDGTEVGRGMVLGSLHGATRGILLGERTALNLLQRMSGIATLTRKFVNAVAGTGAKITDTRKTVPGLRALDKRAVVAGGGVNHRFGLDDMVLIKDNHVAAAGGITPAVDRCRAYLKEQHITAAIEVETTTLDQVREALACPGIARIMLDNFRLNDVKEAVRLIGHAVEVEASGGVTLETVRAIADTGVDFISVGALTHSVTALDISLELSSNV